MSTLLLIVMISFSPSIIMSATSSPPRSAIQAETLKTSLEELRPKASYPCEVASSVKAKLVSEVSGTVTRIVKAIGQKVNRGEVVFFVQQSQFGLNYNQYGVRAPSSGILSRLPISLGELVQAGVPAGEITDSNQLRLLVQVPAVDLNSLKVSSEGTLSILGKTHSVYVSAIAPSVDSITGTAQVELKLKGKELTEKSAQTLPIGAVGSVEINLIPLNVVSVPPRAVVVIDSKSYLRVVEKGNKVKLKSVVLGDVIGDKQVILTGIEPNSEIVVSSSEYLNDGDEIVRKAGG